MISPVGYILIPAALVLFFRGRRALLWTTLLFVPFTTIQVVDLGVTSIAGFQFFGALFIARCLIDSIWSGHRGVTRSLTSGLAALFLLLCAVSLSMAVLKAGTVDVFGESTGGRWIGVARNSSPLRLSFFNFTQLLYPTFGVSLFYFLVRELRSVRDLKKAVNILVGGTLAVAGMGIAMGAFYTVGLGSIYTNLLGLFTVGPLTGVGGPETGSVGQFFRTYTLAGEPGYTAVTLLVGLGFVVGDVLRTRGRGKSLVRSPIVKAAFLAVALLFNGSTTAYFGMALLAVWSVFVLWQTGERAVTRTILYFLGGTLLFAGVASTIQVSGMPFYEWIAQYHLAKLEGEAGSGMIRLYVSRYTMTEVFAASPILGVGYGSHLSLSLVTFLLANVGLLGFGVFLAFLYVVFRNAKTAARGARGPVGAMAFMAVVTFVPFLGTLFIAKSTSAMNYGVTWTVIALAEATYQVYRRKLSPQAA